ncbi:hypothetical protein AB837_00262 [bacterium AB1]|nr:hypothetical protein AB837_00262 [bacterium AB1]
MKRLESAVNKPSDHSLDVVDIFDEQPTSKKLKYSSEFDDLVNNTLLSSNNFLNSSASSSNTVITNPNNNNDENVYFDLDLGLDVSQNVLDVFASSLFEDKLIPDIDFKDFGQHNDDHIIDQHDNITQSTDIVPYVDVVPYVDITEYEDIFYQGDVVQYTDTPTSHTDILYTYTPHADTLTSHTYTQHADTTHTDIQHNSINIVAPNSVFLPSTLSSIPVKELKSQSIVKVKMLKKSVLQDQALDPIYSILEKIRKCKYFDDDDDSQIRSILSDFNFIHHIKDWIERSYYSYGRCSLFLKDYCLEFVSMNILSSSCFFSFVVKYKDQAHPITYSSRTKRAYAIKDISRVKKIDKMLSVSKIEKLILNSTPPADLYFDLQIEHLDFYATALIGKKKQIYNNFQAFFNQKLKKTDNDNYLNFISEHFKYVVNNVFFQFEEYNIEYIDGSFVLFRQIHRVDEVLHKRFVLEECVFLDLFFNNDISKQNRFIPMCFYKNKCTLKFLKDNLKLEDLQYRLYYLNDDDKDQTPCLKYITQTGIESFYDKKEGFFSNVYFANFLFKDQPLFFTMKRPGYMKKNQNILFCHNPNGSVKSFVEQFSKSSSYTALKEFCFLSTFIKNIPDVFQYVLLLSVLYDHQNNKFFTLENTSIHYLPGIFAMLKFLIGFLSSDTVLVCNLDLEIHSHFGQLFLFFLLKRSISNQKCHLHVASNKQIASSDSKNFTFMCLKTQDPDFYKSVHRSVANCENLTQGVCMRDNKSIEPYVNKYFGI